MALSILLLIGSPTSTFHCELSELYTRGCITALADPERYDFIIAHVAPDGTWRFPKSLDTVAAAPPMDFAAAVAVLARTRIAAALPQMFCHRGMTEFRALLDLCAIPYLGNRPMQMALAADKAKARASVAAAGVDVPAAQLLRRGEAPTLPCPAVVKPNDADNSDGITLVTAPSGYIAALDLAFAHADRALVETYIPLGREVRCGVLQKGDVLTCLPLEEYYVDAAARPIRRAIDKLPRDANGDLYLGAKTSAESWIVPAGDPIVEPVWEAARRCHLALGCRQYSLFDFRIDPAGRPWFLEAGLYCSFSPASVIVTMAAAAGRPLRQFFADSLGDLLADPQPTHNLTEFSPEPLQ